MNRAEGSRYFEMACAGWSDGICGGSNLTDPKATWGCNNKSITTATGIGTGEANTTAIVNGCATTGIAARLASELNLGGYSDWFLPSKDEVMQICSKRLSIGLTNDLAFISSSQLDKQTIYNSGYWSNTCLSPAGGKTTSYYVRPIRSF